MTDITTIVSNLQAEASSKIAARKPKRAPRPYTPSLMDSAITVLATSGAELNTVLLYKAVAAANLWAPAKGGRTPERTLYAAILGELEKDAEVRRVERGTVKGTFRATAAAAATRARVEAYYAGAQPAPAEQPAAAPEQLSRKERKAAARQARAEAAKAGEQANA